MAKVKQTFVIEVEVDEDSIVEKYPNYRFNFDNTNEFITHQVRCMKFQGDTDMSKNGMKEWGYSIKVKKLTDIK